MSLQRPIVSNDGPLGRLQRLMSLVQDLPPSDSDGQWYQISLARFQDVELKMAMDRAVDLNLSWLAEDLRTLFRLFGSMLGEQAFRIFQQSTEDLVRSASRCNQRRHHDIAVISQIVQVRWSRRWAVLGLEMRV